MTATSNVKIVFSEPTARLDLDTAALAREPMAGGVLVYRPPFRGLRDARIA